MKWFSKYTLAYFLAIAMLRPSLAYSESYVDTFRKLQETNPDMAMVFLKGVADGVVNTAAYPGFSAFCLPPHMPLGPEVLLALLNEHLSTTKLKIRDNDTVSYLAVRSVKEAFPCE